MWQYTNENWQIHARTLFLQASLTFWRALSFSSSCVFALSNCSCTWSRSFSICCIFFWRAWTSSSAYILRANKRKKNINKLWAKIARLIANYLRSVGPYLFLLVYYWPELAVPALDLIHSLSAASFSGGFEPPLQPNRNL